MNKSFTTHQMDAVQYAVRYADEIEHGTASPYHALLTDSPYELGIFGNTWDETGVSFKKETWESFYRILHDGAFGVSFASARKWHHTAMAIESAGFVIHPTIFLWIYGTGVAKPSKVSLRVDNPELWDEYVYGLQALKPSAEPILVFQKPYKNKAVEDIANYGAGALWVGGTRIPAENSDNKRWPSNFILGNEKSSAILDAQSGNRRSRKKNSAVKGFWKNAISKNDREGSVYKGYGDSGGASRFFYRVSEKINQTDPLFYASKPSRSERNKGLSDENPHHTVKPISLTNYLAKMLLPPAKYAPRRLFVPFCGVGSEMIGAKIAGWEVIDGVEIVKEYTEIARLRMEYWNESLLKV